MRLRRSGWLLLALVLATIPVSGVFTLSRLFVVRDLALTFHSRFLFVRHSILSGTFPLWDPYTANGQSAVADALYQLFHVPSLLVRLIFPEIIAYNLWVALPVPLSAYGTYLFLRRRNGPPASAFGAAAFALAGPMVSTTNFPNMSWSLAATPFVFYAVDRVFARKTSGAAILLAALVACQALAGEPVTLTATLVLAGIYGLVSDRRWRDTRGVVLAAVGGVAGVLLAAIQYVPLLMAGRASMRSTIENTDFWSFHPAALLELLVPHFFGDYFNSNLKELAWMVALNSDRDPFFYTMYIGVAVVLLALVAVFSNRPDTRFWTVVIAACAIASLGPHTPLYPALQELVPPLKTFRFPVKYLTFAAFGVATLAAMTLQWLIDGTEPRRAMRGVLIGATVAAAIAYVALAWLLLAPSWPIRGFFQLALWAHVPAPIQGAEFLLYRARPLFTSLFLKLAAMTFLLWVAASMRRERRLALVVFAAMGMVDLLASNNDVNPTLPASTLAPPEWMSRIPPDMHERLYMGGRLEGYVNVFDVDAPKYAAGFDGYSMMEQRYLLVKQLMFHPSGPRIREGLSYDLPLLWPLEYARTIGYFKYASREERLRFLSRIGTRFVILPTPPYPGAQPLARLEGAEQLQLYDYNPQARRAYVVPDALMGKDVVWQIEGLFQAKFDPARGVLVSEPPPPPAGFPGPAAPMNVSFVEDGLNRVILNASLPAEGYLALLDTYTPDWRVEVDGAPAPLMRANGLFRAVHLVPGRHTVKFTYHPRNLYVGASITAATGFALAAWAVWTRRRSVASRVVPGVAGA